MRILVTGADGLLGSNLVRLLLERGHKVSVLLHPLSRSTSLNDLPVKKYHGDILQPESLSRAFADNHAVIHAAASTSVWPSRSETVCRINIEGTRNIIEASLGHKIKRLVYIGSASSVNTSGPPGGKYAFAGAKFRLDYIDSKYEALNLVMDAAKNRSLPALSILPTFMIGPYDALPGTGKIILSLAQGRLNFYTEGGRNFIYVKDVSVAIANGLEKGRIGHYYVTGNENLTYREFFERAATVMGKTPPKRSAPSWLVKTAGWAGSLSGKVLKKEPLLSYPMARISCEKQYVTSSEAIEELGLPQTPIETAVMECYQWFVDNHYL